MRKTGEVRKFGEILGTANFENAGIAKMNFEIHLISFKEMKQMRK